MLALLRYWQLVTLADNNRILISKFVPFVPSPNISVVFCE